MDELGAFLKEFSLVECAPYLPQGLTLAQLLAMTSLPPALVQEKPKLVKTLNKAIQKYKKSTSNRPRKMMKPSKNRQSPKVSTFPPSRVLCPHFSDRPIRNDVLYWKVDNAKGPTTRILLKIAARVSR